MTFNLFGLLLEDLVESPIFFRWKTGRSDCTNHPSTPLTISLLLLGTLRYLGRGFTFDNIEETTAATSRETHQQFFHAFVKFGSACLYDKHVVMHKTYDERQNHISQRCQLLFSLGVLVALTSPIFLWNVVQIN